MEKTYGRGWSTKVRDWLNTNVKDAKQFNKICKKNKITLGDLFG